MRVFQLSGGSLLALTLLASVPGCGGSSDKSKDDDGGTSTTGGAGGTGGSGKSGGSGGTGVSGRANGTSGEADTSAGTGDTGNPSEPVAETPVNPTGGTVTTDDKAVTIEVPQGALTGDVTITVAPTDPPAKGALGPTYEIGPTGTLFAAPVTITLSYAGIDLGSTDEGSLRVATYGDLGWQVLTGALLDKTHHTVSGLTSHLSPYSIVSWTNGVACANLALGPTSCGSAGASGGSGPPPATDPPPACPVPTCADSADVCSGYPGSTMSDCHDDPVLGVATSCCFPPEAPICFLGAMHVACAGPAAGAGAGSSGGSTGTQCPGTPTCADAADPCFNYPGANFQDCTDDDAGYTGSCCFDPGAAVCVAVVDNISCSADAQCPPSARCADGDPCKARPGTTLSGCTDNDTGFVATCCYAVGTVPTATADSAAGSSSGSAGSPSGSAGGSAGPAPAGGASNGGGASAGTAGAPDAGT